MEFLKEKGVPFEERDVAADPRNMQELLERTGGVRGTPVIIVGDEVMRGFDRGKLSRLLGLH
ncbi:MAG TPA: glutaredoxin domain-containing protein [Bacillota bacterium]|nr:glutaredoxin domain-containing protein [Bacillota bacterium]